MRCRHLRASDSTGLGTISPARTSYHVRVEKVTDQAPRDWVNGAVRKQEGFAQARGVTVGHCIPMGFAAYAKILHPIYANEAAEEGLTWDDLRPRRSLLSRLKSAVRMGDPLEEIMGEGTLVGMGADDAARHNRLTWRQVAEELGRTFHPEINKESFNDPVRGSWPARFYLPDEGDIGPDFTKRLVSILARHTEPQRCYFFYDAITGHDEDDFEDTLYCGELVDLPTWVVENDFSTPTLWWPEDQSWCVQCDEDLTFTFVGGARQLVDEILGDDLLETVEVTIDHRVDDLADTINVKDAQAERDKEPDPPVVPDPTDDKATVTVEAVLSAFKEAGFSVEIAETSPDYTHISNIDAAAEHESLVACSVYRTSKAAKKESDRHDECVGNAVCSLMLIDSPPEHQQHSKAQFAAAVRSLGKKR